MHIYTPDQQTAVGLGFGTAAAGPRLIHSQNCGQQVLSDEY